MDNKDTFQTIGYKGEAIQTCYNRTQQCDEIKWNGKQYKSLSAAKVAITKSQGSKPATVAVITRTVPQSPVLAIMPARNFKAYRKHGKARSMFKR